MKKYIMKKAWITLMVCLLGCHSSSYSSMLLKCFFEIEIFERSDFNYKYLIVIPSSGCPGCISYAENFFIENRERTDIFFVFTNIYSKKDLKIRVGESNLSLANVYVDSHNRLYLSKYDDNKYPVFFKFQDNNIEFGYLDGSKILQ